MPQARPAIRRRYPVLVKGRRRASVKTWAWEIRRAPEQLAVQLQKGWLQYSKSCQACRRKAMQTLLSLSGDKLNANSMPKQEREACTYDTVSLSLPTARDANVTPCVFGGYGL